MVTLPMPPMFCSARHSSPENSNASAIGTSGAPCPPAATSRTRKSLTTSTPVRSAITAASPSCHVECGASCQIVWPCEPIARTSALAHAGLGDARRRRRRRANCRDRTRAGSSRGRCRSSSARARRSRCSAVYVVPMNASRSASSAPVRRGVNAHGRGGDAVERRAGHQPDVDAHGTRTGGGARCTARRMTPPAASSACSASSRASAEKVHDDRRLHDAAAPVEQLARRGAIDLADLHEDSLTAVLQLLVRRAQVDHQVAERLAEADHRARRDHVEHELGRRARPSCAWSR